MSRSQKTSQLCLARALVVALFWALAAALAPGQADEPPKSSAPAKAASQPPAKAPWQRLLTGADVKRVADLEAKPEKL